MNQSDFHAEVVERFGILPNFFQSAKAAPELVQELWGFAKAGYLDNPMPSLFKERLFVWLSRFCPMRRWWVCCGAQPPGIGTWTPSTPRSIA
jgi:hypothetical protein